MVLLFLRDTNEFEKFQDKSILEQRMAKDCYMRVTETKQNKL